MPGPGALAAELAAHRAGCPSCRWGTPAACPVAVALDHALTASAP
ncbi:MAG TPA: hypothetical protein VMW47_05280 [Verrucomicrobiae bacterium]|nr:hypothetical protein [Verrucomicrobiae bacterium]